MYNNLKTNLKTYKNILRKTVREAKRFTTLEFSYNIKIIFNKLSPLLNKNTQHIDLTARFVHNDMIVDTPN